MGSKTEHLQRLMALQRRISSLANAKLKFTRTSMKVNLSLISEAIPSVDIVGCGCGLGGGRFVTIIVVVYVTPSASADIYLQFFDILEQFTLNTN